MAASPHLGPQHGRISADSPLVFVRTRVMRPFEALEMVEAWVRPSLHGLKGLQHGRSGADSPLVFVCARAMKPFEVSEMAVALLRPGLNRPQRASAWPQRRRISMGFRASPVVGSGRALLLTVSLHPSAPSRVN